MDNNGKQFLHFSETDATLSTVKRRGLAFFEGVDSLDDLIWLSYKFGVPILHRDADYRGVITLSPHESDQEETFKGYTRKEQYLHTDGTMVESPADLVLLSCQKLAPKGGHSTFVDGLDLYKRIARDKPELLKHLMADDAALFGEPRGEHTTKPVFSARAGYISISFRHDRLVEYSKEVTENFDYLKSAIDSLTTSVKLRPGQGYILNNHRYIHGRSSFEGDRIIHRVQLHAKKGLALEPGFKASL